MQELAAPATARERRYMVDDLAHRCHPDQLAHIRAALRDLTAGAS